MGQPKEQQNASMWQEIDGLRHQTAGQLKVKYRAVFGQESRSSTPLRCATNTRSDRLYTFGTSPEQLRRLGARGGRAYSRNQRARRALLATPPEAVPPRAVSPATTAESIAILDARFPWLRGAEKRLPGNQPPLAPMRRRAPEQLNECQNGNVQRQHWNDLRVNNASV